MELKLGLKGHYEEEVTFETTAKAYRSGQQPVFSTPHLVAIMELACATSVEPYLDAGCDTVGTSVDIRHLSATPIGMKVRTESELIGIDGRMLKFAVRGYDEKGLIGEGVHGRAIINAEKFAAKTQSKLDK